MRRIHGLLYAAVALLALTTLTWAQSDQPSLGDVARQKSAAKARKVVTNDEIPLSPEANNPPVSSSAAAASSSGAAPGVKADAGKDGDQPATSAEKQNKLPALMKEVASLKTIVKTLQDQIDATNDPNRIETLSQVLQHAKDSLLQNQEEIEKLKAGAAAAGQGDAPPAADQPPAAQPSTAEQPAEPK